MPRILLIALLFGLSWTACKDNAPSATETTTEAPPTDMMTPGTPAAPASTTGVSNPNPPHGQPGHRCDIPVGASLDGAPAQPQQQQNSSPVFQNAPAATTPVTPQPGAANVSNPNPPHGQPNHRCDIPVGASLDTPVRQ